MILKNMEIFLSRSRNKTKKEKEYDKNFQISLFSLR